MKAIFQAVAAVLVLAGSATASPSANDLRRIAAMDAGLRPARAPADVPTKTIAQRMTDLNVPGVSIAFIEDGRVKWTRTYGVAVASERRAVTPETLFQAASMSKAVAAAGALRLVEEGRLDLDEDVNRRLKGWQVPASAFTMAEKVTLRRLLSHTAGLTVSGVPGYAMSKPIPTAVQILKGEPPSNTPAVVSFEPPGQGFAYSGGGYTVAQLLMVEAGGEPYPALLKRLVLRPAGMRSSTFEQPLPARLVRNSASAHGVRGLVYPGTPNTYPEYAAASLWTTPSDYGRFMIALQTAHAGGQRRLLRQTSARTMMTPILGGYGLGMALGRREGRTTFEHGGGNLGFQCYAFAFLDGSRQGAVVMTNSDGGGILVGEIIRALGNSYGWGEAAPPDGPFRRAPSGPTVAR